VSVALSGVVEFLLSKIKGDIEQSSSRLIVHYPCITESLVSGKVWLDSNIIFRYLLYCKIDVEFTVYKYIHTVHQSVHCITPLSSRNLEKTRKISNDFNLYVSINV